jgi:hypothetical protein
LIGGSAVARELLFVFYLHRERCRLFVRLSLLLRKRTPFLNNLVPGVYFAHFPFSLCSTIRRMHAYFEA